MSLSLCKRPCKICRKWFQPHPKAGNRQRTCSRPECQRERHRRSCTDWHKRNAEDDREHRLRTKLNFLGDEQAADAHSDVDPLRGLSWSAVRDAVGLQVAVVLEESEKLIVLWARDAVKAHLSEKKGKIQKVPQSAHETR